ncbi:hypothetical protein PCL_08654 [Purpureocillium lilacinum]|uniref:uracil phosphoribosyltransferase n=1 Tax=Purpureocillium lilacinum TaxID=33203 RepID=A0A2U3DR27_PURLI|nr:hypothetical protein Purlil1_11923 [Purpureocillium lilacinum]PWI64685.1 hypothetical protein PCL_08654 [Purpureocillium lilacinum]
MATAPKECVGPSHLSQEQKPSATVSAKVPFDNVHVLSQTPQLIALLSMIRNKDTDRADFIFYSNRIIRLLVEEGLNHLPVIEHDITTPVGRTYNGLMFQGKICGVSIMRAGEAMEQGLRDCCRSVRIGKILIQRDEDTAQPKLFYDKLPEDIAERWVLLLDPMFATGEGPDGRGLEGVVSEQGCTADSVARIGGSAIMAVEVLKARGVPEDRILFLNLIASPEGVGNFATKFPRLKVVTAFIDEGLDEKNYIVPGLGDFGDRFYTI